MSVLSSTRLHYQTAFDIRVVEGMSPSCLWEIVYAWVSAKTREIDISRWFVGGGSSSSRRTSVEIVSEIGAWTEEWPEYWALSMQETDGKYWFRHWHTSITMRRVDPLHVRFVISIGHSILPGYIGKDGALSQPSSPRLVREILTSPNFTVSNGSSRLYATAQTLDQWEALRLIDFISDPNRSVALILCTGDTVTSGEQLFQTQGLASDLAGTALVYYANSAEVIFTLEKELPPNFKVRPSMLRVYQARSTPALDPQGIQSRFFNRESLSVRSPSEIREIIVQAISRRPLQLSSRDISHIRDIEDIRRSKRLQQLTAVGHDGAWAEIEQLYKEEMESLQSKLTLAEEERRFFEQQALSFEDQVEDLVDAAKHSEFRIRSLQDDVRTLRRSSDAALQTKTVVEQFESLPRTLAETLELIELLRSDRLMVLPIAKASAIASEFDDLPTAWSCLFSVSSVLYDLCFKEPVLSTTRISECYQASTHFELAWTETKQTKNDRKIMSSRHVLYGNTTLDLTPHVKAFKNGKYLRVHFHVDREKRLIIIGHCGDHLDTAGTRKNR